MTDNYHNPAFNLKAVVQETGLKPDTLRAWERRYGLPQPGRTDGGHRLYSQYDIDVLNWLAARQDEGLSISRAVKLWKQMEDEGRNPLLTVESAVSPTLSTLTVNPTGQSLDQLRDTWIESCLNFDERSARQVLAQAFAIFPVKMVCFELLQRALSEIGEGWYSGDISVQQEHFASALALRQLEALLASAPNPTKPGRILVACPPNEQHTFSPLLFTLLLKRAGWDVVYLGANVPVDRLRAAIEPIQPNLVVLIAQTLPAAANMLEIANTVIEDQIPVAYGGAVFNTIPAVRERVPGQFLGESIEHSIKVVNRLMGIHPTPSVEKKWPSPTYVAALNHYATSRTAVEKNITTLVPANAMPDTYLEMANAQLSLNITAALMLGDMNLLTPDIEWVRGLVANYPNRLSKDIMSTYLHLYRQAVETVMDHRARPIINWLARVA